MQLSLRQRFSPRSWLDQANAQKSPLTEKLNAYVGCINRLSERSYNSRSRYFSWADKKGPTGKERIIYGTYTIYDTSDCRKNVEKANAMEPHDAAIEAAATAYADAVSKLEPLLKETDDYYSQENYKDDKMAKGKALHPRLVAAWDAFAAADQKLRGEVEAINDRRAQEKLAEIEKSEGRKTRYYVEALMIQAKRVLRAEDAKNSRHRRDHAGAERVRRNHQGSRAGFGFRRRAEDRLVLLEQCEVLSGHGEATDAPHPRQGALQFRRQDDAQQCRQRLDGRGFPAAAAARLQPAGRGL